MDHTPNTPLLKDWKSFKELKEALNKAEAGSDHRLLLFCDFRGSWGLPMFYLEAYVDKHGKDSVYEGIDAPVDDPQLIKELKEFTDFGELPSGEFHSGEKGHEKLIAEVVDSKHILMYAYSENMGEALQKAAAKNKHKRVLRIVSPSLDDSNNLLTYTDAIIVNKSKFADLRELHLLRCLWNSILLWLFVQALPLVRIYQVQLPTSAMFYQLVGPFSPKKM